MKFLILGLVAFAILDLIAAELEPYYPVPIDDPIVKEALDAKKSQIILDLIQTYPNITINPIFSINSAERKVSGLATSPPFETYRLNLTLAVRKPDPNNSKAPGIYTPIVTFYVAIETRDYTSHREFGALQYAGIQLPDYVATFPLPVLDSTPSKDKKEFTGNIATNDTGLWIAITALQDQIWANLENNKEKIIPRPNATSAPKDDFATDNFVIYEFERNKTTGNLQSSYALPLLVLAAAKESPSFLLIRPKKPVQIWVTLVAEHKASGESFYLDSFDFVADSTSDKLADTPQDLILISPGPDHDCDHYLGDPEPVDAKSKQLWTVFNALKKDAVKLLKAYYWRENINDDSLFLFNNGSVKYKNNHGDLDAPIVREISANFTVQEVPSSGSVNPWLPLRTIVPSTIILLQESIDVVKGGSTYKLLKVDSCKPEGPCFVPY